MGSDKVAPFQYIEVIEVNNDDGLAGDFEGPIMQKIGEEFLEFADAPLFIAAEALV